MTTTEIVEATLYTMWEAVEDPSIDIAKWGNKYMARIVNDIRKKDEQIADLTLKLETLTLLHEETKNDLSRIKAQDS